MGIWWWSHLDVACVLGQEPFNHVLESRPNKFTTSPGWTWTGMSLGSAADVRSAVNRHLYTPPRRSPVTTTARPRWRWVWKVRVDMAEDLDRDYAHPKRRTQGTWCWTLVRLREKPRQVDSGCRPHSGSLARDLGSKLYWHCWVGASLCWELNTCETFSYNASFLSVWMHAASFSKALLKLRNNTLKAQF